MAKNPRYSGLISLSDRPEEERRAICSKGGKISSENRRHRKTLKEELLLLLSEGDTQKNISVAMIKKALKGDVKAFECIRDSIGEKPKDEVNITSNDIKINIK